MPCSTRCGADNAALLAEGKITDGTFTYAVNMVNTYLIRRALCSLAPGSISRIFTTVFRSVMEECNGNYENALAVMKKHLVNVNIYNSTRMPDDTEFRYYLLNANMYIVRNPLRIVLEMIELEGNSAPVDLSKLSVEHLMPQDGSKWAKKLHIDKDDYDMWRGRLGNLTLVSKTDNSRAKNNIWEKKKELFASTSHLRLNEEILKAKTWNIDTIEKRTQSLADKIILMFPYFESPRDMIKIHLLSDSTGFIANAIFYCDNGDVKILSGSMLSPRGKDDTNEHQKWFDDCIENGKIAKTLMGYVFKEDFTVWTGKHDTAALTGAANFILNRKVSGKDYWLDESGQPIRTNALFADSKFGTRQK